MLLMCQYLIGNITDELDTLVIQQLDTVVIICDSDQVTVGTVEKYVVHR